MRILIVSFAVLLFVCIAWFASTEGLQPDSISTREDSSADDRVSRFAELTVRAEEPGEAAREPMVELRIAKVAVDERITIAGRVVLLDLEDDRHEGESGSLRVTFPDEGTSEIEIAIEAGHFSFEMIPGDLFFFCGVRLSGFECSFDSPLREQPAVRNKDFVLEVHKALPATLVVRDRVTRQDLVGLTVWNQAGWMPLELPPPVGGGLGRTLLEHQSSPIHLPLRGGRQTWWVRAHGYHWEQVSFDHRYGGELVVFLEHESSVVVLVEGEGRERVGFVSVDRVHPPSQLELKNASSAPLRFEGLLAGQFLVRALDVAGSPRKLPLAIAEVELRAGETSEVSLRVPIEVESRNVPVRGTLELPAEARHMFHSLVWRCLREGEVEETIRVSWPFSSVGSSESLLEWATEKLSPGAWEVEAQPFGHFESVAIGDSGSDGVALRVPPLAEVLVQVRAVDSREPLTRAKIRWSPRDGRMGSYGRPSEETEEPGVFRFFTVPGRVWISARSGRRGVPEYAGATQVVGVHTGTQRIVFELHRSRRISFQLKAGLTILKRDYAWWQSGQVERLDGVGEVSSRSYSQDSARTSIAVSAPGLYRFTFAKLDGYLAIDPIEMFVEEAIHRVEIQLVRE